MPLLKPLNPPLQNWRGTTVWLVGASTGIGEATASALHALGAQVVVSARKAQALDAFVQAHPGSRALPLDVTDAQAVQTAAAQLQAQGRLDCVVYCAGHISLVGSVAGYRGLPNSLAYGPTKAALINLSETLYLDLHDKGIGVSIINPGFVQTPLTANNQFDMPALLTPAQAAQAIVKGWSRGAFEIHFPKRFTLWMKVLRLLPNRVFFALVRKAAL
jgi:short-subunit dehydrogenase